MLMQPSDNEELEALISGYLDGELSPEQARELEDRLERSPEFRAEFDRMRRLVQATSGLRFEDPPDEVWDHFLDNVYNRLERRMGWLVFVMGTLVLVGYALYHYLVDSWASPLIKVIVAAPLIGLTILLISVWRQRLSIAKEDRYSRDIFR
jgi:ferric-dicitrate binding protein FerR (iron transport regulator)